MEPKIELEEGIVELAEKVGMEAEKLAEMKIELRALEVQITENTLGDGISPLGATQDYTGVPLQEAGLMRSACDQMKWAYDNTGLRYMPFFKLDFQTPTQGIEIYKGDVLIDTIVVPITGGMDSDPTAQISKDMYLMIGMLLKHASEYSQKNQ